jgi:signal peptidase II
MRINAYLQLPWLALLVFLLDQLTKSAMLKYLGYMDERVIVPDFFKLVLWDNTGAAWSLFFGNNSILAVIGLAAFVILFLTRHHFELHILGRRLSLGLILGGILGNLVDRLLRGHVIDFLYFYLIQRDGSELGFPAFNVADSAICIGVGWLLLSSFRSAASKSAMPQS